MEEMISRINVISIIIGIVFIISIIKITMGSGNFRTDSEKTWGVVLLVCIISSIILSVISPGCEEMYDEGLITYNEYIECMEDEERRMNEEPIYY